MDFWNLGEVGWSQKFLLQLLSNLTSNFDRLPPYVIMLLMDSILVVIDNLKDELLISDFFHSTSCHDQYFFQSLCFQAIHSFTK